MLTTGLVQEYGFVGNSSPIGETTNLSSYSSESKHHSYYNIPADSSPMELYSDDGVARAANVYDPSLSPTTSSHIAQLFSSTNRKRKMSDNDYGGCDDEYIDMPLNITLDCKRRSGTPIETHIQGIFVGLPNHLTVMLIVI